MCNVLHRLQTFATFQCTNEGRSSLHLRPTTSTSPTPRLDSLPDEEEATNNRIVVVGALVLTGVAVLILLVVLLVAGVMIMRARRKKSHKPSAIQLDEFETRYQRGEYA